MKDFVLKLKVLIGMLSEAFIEWKRIVNSESPDDRFCCTGDMCGCGGVTNREAWKRGW